MKNSKNLSVTMVVLFALTFSMSSCTKKVYVPAPAQPTSEQINDSKTGFSVVTVPCQDEAYDKPGEYLAGLGSAIGCKNPNYAMHEAQQNAERLITAKYMGIIKNSIIRYNKTITTDTQIPSKLLEESGQSTIGMEAIKKFITTVCHNFVREDTGGWGCFVAVHILQDKIEEAVKEDLAARKVEFDADKFFKGMNQEIKELQNN